MTFKSRLFASFVALTVGATALLAVWSYSLFTDAIESEAMRAVAIKAEGREETLRAVLRAKQSRLASFLSAAPSRCAARGRRGCLERALAGLVASEGGSAALLRHGAGSVSVGEDDGWAGAVEIPSGQLATFGFDDTGQPFYLLGARTEGASIVLRLPLQGIDELFLDRRGLGQTGETFLTDGRGLFLTPPRHPGHSGTSHPIEALPMQRCLAGEDGVMRAPDYRGVDVIHAFRHLSDVGGGCIMAHIEPHEVLLPAQRYRAQIVTASVVLALLSAVAAGLLARSITRPISRLRAVADALRRCEFECVEEMKKGPPEIRAFADTFMSMARAVTSARQTLERAVVAREDLLAVVSHDLRNPLNAINLQTEVLRREMQRSDTADVSVARVDRIQNAAKRMNRLIADLLDAAAIERGTLSVDRRDTEPCELIGETLEMMGPVVAARSITVDSEIGPCLPKVSCDEERLLQVLCNLVGNAIKFSPEGSVVTLRATRREGRVAFSVADRGPGIPREALPNLFSPYWHATRRSGGGTGLGLFIAKGIVEAHGGELRVQTTAGIGSTFTFDLPIGDAALSRPPAGGASSTQPEGQPSL